MARIFDHLDFPLPEKVLNRGTYFKKEVSACYVSRQEMKCAEMETRGSTCAAALL